MSFLECIGILVYCGDVYQGEGAGGGGGGGGGGGVGAETRARLEGEMWHAYDLLSCTMFSIPQPVP